jgi:hypothetical protein
VQSFCAVNQALFGKLVRKVGDKCLGQRIIWKFLLKLGKETDIFEMLKEAYGEEVMLRARVFEAFKWFSEGKGRSFSSTVELGARQQQNLM